MSSPALDALLRELRDALVDPPEFEVAVGITSNQEPVIEKQRDWVLAANGVNVYDYEANNVKLDEPGPALQLCRWLRSHPQEFDGLPFAAQDALEESVRLIEAGLGCFTHSRARLVRLIDEVLKPDAKSVLAVKKRRRRTPPQDPTPVTPEQFEALHLMAEHKGNYSAAARAAGISRVAMTKRYKKAMKKLSRSAAVLKKKPTTQPLPLDRRGQVNLPDEEE
jgi:predicted DNA-binding protein (UPF0251 family)